MHIKRCAFVLDDILNGINSIKRYVDASVNVPVIVFLCRPNVKQNSADICSYSATPVLMSAVLRKKLNSPIFFLLTALLQFALSVYNQQPDSRAFRF